MTKGLLAVEEVCVSSQGHLFFYVLSARNRLNFSRLLELKRNGECALLAI